uniref:hypothetical protein n=1 Tax=Mariniphaga sediminis TaxID=1628158 RepID=UPI003567413A
MKKYSFIALIILTIILALDMNIMAGDKGKPVYYDAPFLQDYSIKYYFEQPGVSLKKVAADRNGKIQVLSSEGLLHPHDGAFLYPGTLEKDGTYRPMADKNLKDLASYQQQLVYLDEEAVLSNAWAGKPFLKHQMPGANLFAGAEDFTFMVVEGRDLKLLKGTDQLWKGKTTDQVLDLKYVSSTGKFWILTPGTLQTFSLQKMELETVFKGMGFTAFDVVAFGAKT